MTENSKRMVAIQRSQLVCDLVVAMHANEIDSEYSKCTLYVWKCFKWCTLQLPHCHSVYVFLIKYYVSIWEIEWQLYFSSCLNRFAVQHMHTHTIMHIAHAYVCVFGVKISGIYFQFLSELFPSSYPPHTQRGTVCLWLYTMSVDWIHL